MVVRLSGGLSDHIEPPLLIFKNKNRNYPIRKVANLNNRVTYKTRPKRWIDVTVMPQWLAERKVIDAFPNERKAAVTR